MVARQRPLPESLLLSIIVVSWNTRELLRQCLLSVLKNSGHSIGFFLIDRGNGNLSKMEEAWDWFWSIPYKLPKNKLIRRIRNYISRKLDINLYQPYQLDEWYCDSLDNKLISLKEQISFDVVIVEYVFFSRALELFPDSLKIIDTHDVFGDRHKLFIGQGKRPAVEQVKEFSDHEHVHGGCAGGGFALTMRQLPLKQTKRTDQQ